MLYSELSPCHLVVKCSYLPIFRTGFVLFILMINHKRTPLWWKAKYKMVVAWRSLLCCLYAEDLDNRNCRGLKVNITEILFTICNNIS